MLPPQLIQKHSRFDPNSQLFPQYHSSNNFLNFGSTLVPLLSLQFRKSIVRADEKGKYPAPHLSFELSLSEYFLTKEQPTYALQSNSSQLAFLECFGARVVPHDVLGVRVDVLQGFAQLSIFNYNENCLADEPEGRPASDWPRL